MRTGMLGLAVLGLLGAGCGGGGGGAVDASTGVDASTAVDASADLDGGPADDGAVTGDAGGDGASADALIGGARLEFDRATQDFGSVVSGTVSSPVTFMLMNTGTAATGSISLGLSGANASEFLSSGNGCSDLQPGAMCTVTMVFTPTGEGSRAAVLTATPLNGGSGSLIVFGTGAPRVPRLQVTPTTQAFGSVVAGALSGTFTFRVDNIGVARTGATTFAITGANAADFVNDIPTSGDCSANLQLDPGQGCNVRLRFGPATIGAKVAVLEASASPGGTTTASLTGTGVASGSAVLVLAPAGTQDFGTIAPGISGAPVTFMVTNSGQAATGTISVSLAGPSASMFVKSSDGCNNASLAAGQSCSFRLAFTPTVAGAHSASLAVVANPGGLITSNLLGTGAAPLTVTTSGMGSVSSSPAGVSCPGSCSATFNQSPVTLTATAAPGWALAAWGGACTGTSSTCDVIMNSTRTVSASFLQLRQLTVATTGMGQVTSSVGAITCPGTCQANLLDGTAVTLTAAAAPGYRFDSWSLASCASTGTVCMLTADADRSVTANFVALETLSVTVSSLGVGSGSVTITPQGQAPSTCAVGTCTRQIDRGSNVTLVATSSADTRFNGWTGDCATFGTGGSCTLLMDRPRATSVAFESYNLNLNAAGPAGGGTIAYSSTTCPTTCSRNYPPGTAVTLTPTAMAGFLFLGWSGDCTGTAACMLTMGQNRSAVATFATRRTLTLSRTGNAGGTITTPDLQINCGNTCTSDTGDYADGSSVTLTAALTAGYGVTWGGACAGATDNTCTVLMDQALSVSATIAGASDLAITALSCTDAVVPGGTVLCSVTVENQGTLATIATVTHVLVSTDAALTTSDTTVGTCNLPALNPGQSMTQSCSATLSSVSFPRGLYWVGAEADATNLVGETQAANNFGGPETLVVSGSGIDLTVAALSCTPNPVDRGGQITCTATLANTGSTAAPAFTTSVRLSADASIDAGDVEIGTCTSLGLAGTATAQLTCTGTVPAGVSGGRFVGLWVDASNQISESSESNNTASAVVSVIIPGAIDLTLTAWSCSPDRGAAGSVTSLNCSATVRNDGALAAPVSTLEVRRSADAVIDGSDTLLKSCAVPALAAATTATVTCSAATGGAWTIPAGAWQIGAIVDGPGAITEDSESNNTAVDGYLAGPDLQVASIACTPAPLLAGGAITCSLTFRNAGAQATTTTSYRLYRSSDAVITTADSLVATCSLAAVSADTTSATQTCMATLGPSTPPGSAFIGAIADYNAQLAELDENNNTGSVAVTITAIDLVTTSVVCGDAVVAGGGLTCLVSVTNSGDAAAPASTGRLRLSSDSVIGSSDVDLGTCALGALAAGATSNLSCPVTIPAGTARGLYYLGFVANDGSTVPETSTTNNTATDLVGVAQVGVVDLYAASAVCAPSPVIQGASITCTTQLWNLGGQAAPAFVVRITQNGVGIMDCPIAGQAAASLVAVPCTGTVSAAAAGQTGFRVDADASGLIPEADELNNGVYLGTIMVIKPGVIDLSPRQNSCTPASAPLGDVAISCNVTVENLGELAAPASSVDLRLSPDGSFQTSDPLVVTCAVPALAGGASTLLTCAGTINRQTPSRSFVLAVVDVPNAVAEGAENNNVVQSNGTMVIGPNLVVTATTCSPSPVARGATVSCSATVRSNGGQGTPAFNLGLFESANSSISPSDTLLGSCSGAALAQNAQTVMTCTGTVPAGSAIGPQYFGVMADFDLQLEEADETDNTGAQVLTVQ